jgi:hypothetical protein
MRSLIDIVALMERQLVQQREIDQAVAATIKDADGYSLRTIFQDFVGWDGEGDEEKAFRDWIESEAYDGIGRIENHFRGDKLPIFRELTAPKDWDYRTETRPHKYWCYDRDVAHAHWGGEETDDEARWLIEAEATFDQIDWVRTIALAANMALSPECEVCIKDSVMPTITHCAPRPEDFTNKIF